MHTNNHQQEIDQIYRHLKYLSVAGGIALTFLFVGVHMLLSDHNNEDWEVQGMIDDAIEDKMVPEELSFSSEEIIEENKILLSNSPDNDELNDYHAGSIKPVIPHSAPEVSEVAGASLNNQQNSRKHLKDELLDFRAYCESGTINIQFETTGLPDEVYEIEKSHDRTNFKAMSKVRKSRLLNGKNQYSHVFECSDNSELYFRLKRKGLKGKFEYSDIAEASCIVKQNKNTKIDVYPIGYGSFKILINTQEHDHFSVTLADSEKREIATEGFDVFNGANEFVLKSGSIPRGSYTLRVSNGEIVTEKMVFLK